MVKDLMIYMFSLLLFVIVILVPIFLYIKKKKSKDAFQYLKLKGNWQRGILVGSIVSIFYIGLLILKGKVNNTLNVNFNIGIRWLYGLSVGLLEEIPIRGFLLRRFQERFSFIFSNIFSTLIFVSFHFPTWIIGGANIIQSAVSISVVSLVFGYLVKEYDSLWVTIICHSVFNICIWMGLA